jgi:protein O-mannosyl-transferase
MLRKGNSPPKSQPARPSPKPVGAPSSSTLSLPSNYRTVLVCLGLVLAIFLAYGHLCGADAEFFRLDDGEYVVNNPHIHDGLTFQSMRWAFTSFDAMNWHPLTWLSLQLDYELHGLSAGGYRLTNVILHAISSVLLLLVLTRMTGAFWPSAVVAGLFALHPLRVESVAWVAERKDVLSTLFWILTMGAYCWYVERPSRWRYLLVFISFALGLMAKPMVVTLPFALLLLDYWPLHRLDFGLVQDENNTSPEPDDTQVPWTWLILEKIPLFALSAAACVITVLAQGVMQETLFATQPWYLRILNAALSYMRYVIKTLWPGDLAPMYSQPLDQFPYWQSIVAVVIFVGITILCLAWIRRRPYLAVGWFWFIGTLVPVIGLMQVGLQTMADRYTYIPHIGLFLMLVWGAGESLSTRCSPALRACITTLLLLACLASSFLQARLWQDSITLWAHTVTVTTSNFAAYDCLGVSLMAKGRVNDALPQFRKSIELEPRYAKAHIHLGLALEDLQKWSDAAHCFATAIRLVPMMIEAHQELAKCYLTLQQMEEAQAPISVIVEAAPNSPISHGNYCMILLYLGKLPEAEREGAEALRLDPRLQEAKKLMGYIKAIQGKPAEAEQFFRSALYDGPANRPDSTAAYYLAWSLQAQGKTEAAREQYRLATQQSPRWPRLVREEAWRLATHPEARRRNGPLALLRAQVVSQAADDKDAGALEAVAAAYAELGQFPEAVNTQRKAIGFAGSSQSKELTEAMNQRLRLYEQGQPFREQTTLANTQSNK